MQQTYHSTRRLTRPAQAGAPRPRPGPGWALALGLGLLAALAAPIRAAGAADALAPRAGTSPTPARQSAAQPRTNAAPPPAQSKTRGPGGPQAKGPLGDARPVGFVWLPPLDRFLMGSPDEEADRFENEGPQVSVTFTNGFYLCQHEVTQAEYEAVMKTNPAAFKEDPRCPVERVSWQDATNYCARLTQRERREGRLPTNSTWRYRLPTEAQWEYAARAGTTNRFSFGDEPRYARLSEYAWHVANSENQTHPVQTKRQNRWGFFDMGGNVWEWCGDWYGSYGAYARARALDPRGQPTGAFRVVRGGGWYGLSADCRSAARDGRTPDARLDNLGFRVVLAAGQ